MQRFTHCTADCKFTSAFARCQRLHSCCPTEYQTVYTGSRTTLRYPISQAVATSGVLQYRQPIIIRSAFHLRIVAPRHIFLENEFFFSVICRVPSSSATAEREHAEWAGSSLLSPWRRSAPAVNLSQKTRAPLGSPDCERNL